MKFQLQKKSGFNDVDAGHWAAPSIAAAAKAGYLKGYPDGAYHPDETLTRAQGISLIMRLSSQKEREALPQLKDMNKDHWAAADLATALKAGMIGLSTDGSQIYPEQPLTRGSLARALATLLTKDPGLYIKTLSGTIKDIKGAIKLTRNGTTTTLQNNAPVYKGDSISSGANSTASIVYPDGSSVLIKENTELQIKESLGRACIKEDGTGGIAVENVDFDLKKGTLLGALATKHENTPGKPQAQNGETLLASLDGLGYIAETGKTLPWYQQAEVKKVKMKVDMPYGVAAIRGTYVLVTIKQDEQGNIIGCDVSCLTGDATVTGNKDQIGTNLNANTGTTLTNQGNTTGAGAISEEERNKLAEAAVQKWVVNTALNMDQNKEATVERLIEVPDNAPVEQQIQNTIVIVLKALGASGIQLNEEVKKELEDKVNKELIEEQVKQAQENNQANQNNNQNTGGGGSTEESSASYLNYAAADTTYGPENPADAQTIGKNVIVSAPRITLRNMIITRDLTLAAGIGSGEVTLENVQVKGATNVLGGGSNSVTLVNCDLYTVTVDKNEVRIVAKGTSKVGALTLNSGAKLEESQLSGSGFSTITTGTGIPSGATIILSGSFAAVDITRPGLTIQLEPGSSINTLTISAQANITGTGQIMNAVINAAGVTMQQAPLNWSTAAGVIFTAAGQSRGGNSTSNAKLFSLSLSPGVLSPAFSPDTFTYTASVGNSVYEVIVAAIPQESTAAVKVNGVGKAGNTHVLNMEAGANTIEILVTSPDGTASREYDLTITRAGSSTKTISEFKFDGLSPAVIGSITEANQTNHRRRCRLRNKGRTLIF